MKGEAASTSSISKRFELLESQWVDFQRRSATPDLEEEPMTFASSLQASGDASPVASQATAKGNLALSRIKPTPAKVQDQPDSPLSSSSTVSLSSSSSSSDSSFHPDGLTLGRKRLFPEPYTPIKKTVADSSPRKTQLHKQRSGSCSQTIWQSRSPPSGSNTGVCSPSNGDSPRALLRKYSACSRSEEKEEKTEFAAGARVLRELRDSLLGVLEQLESKEKSIRDAWKQQKDVPEFTRAFKHSSELESLTSSKGLGFSGISQVVKDGDMHGWCEMGHNLCQRLSAYLQKETMLQKWAIALEKEVMRVLKLEEDIVEAKVHSAQELELAKKMKRRAEESAAEERESLAKDRDSLLQWVGQMQERQTAVIERERQVAMSIEELKSSSQQLEEDQKIVSCEKQRLKERELAIEAMEKEAQSQISSITEMQEELRSNQEQLKRKSANEEKEKSKRAALEHKLKRKHKELQQLEKDLADKVLATENLSKKLVNRERMLSELQSKFEEEKQKMKESREEVFMQTAEDRKRAKRTEEKLRRWEGSLKEKEKDLQRQEGYVRQKQAQIEEQQHRLHALQAKVMKDQEASIAKEGDIKRKEAIAENKAAEARKELEKLHREHRQIFVECKRMEAKMSEAQRALEARQRQVREMEEERESKEATAAERRRRLEAVMNSLIEARQASRSRFQRTEKALQALPALASSTFEVKQALRMLSGRLSEMEQVEEGLARQLREAYESEFSELEGSIVDKVELLCKMEEQQNVRAEWERDMQRQLERINRLQTASPDCYDNMMTMERALSPIVQQHQQQQQQLGLGTTTRSSPLVTTPAEWSMGLGSSRLQTPLMSPTFEAS